MLHVFTFCMLPLDTVLPHQHSSSVNVAHSLHLRAALHDAASYLAPISHLSHTYLTPGWLCYLGSCDPAPLVDSWDETFAKG